MLLLRYCVSTANLTKIYSGTVPTEKNPGEFYANFRHATYDIDTHTALPLRIKRRSYYVQAALLLFLRRTCGVCMANRSCYMYEGAVTFLNCLKSCCTFANPRERVVPTTNDTEYKK